MMQTNKLIFITDSSFKKDILIDWGIIYIFKLYFSDVYHICETSFSADVFNKKSGDNIKITAVYCLNSISSETEKIIKNFSSKDTINQFIVVCDCFSEKLNETDLLPRVSFLELLVKNKVPAKTEEKNIVLINPEGWQKESTNLGLAYIAGSLRTLGFKPKIFDLNRYEMTYEQVKDKIADLNPFIIGYSAKTAVAEESAKLCGYLKKFFPDTKMVIGGPHITLCAAEFLEKNHSFDAGILSEAEILFPKLALSYAAGIPIDNLENAAYRKNGRIIVNDYAPPQNINFPFLPDFDCIDNFSWNNYRYPVVTSRGCPYGCIYCCVNKLTGDRKWRYRAPENVIDELKYVKKKYNISLFEIWDDNFTLNIDRAKKICQAIIDEKLNLSWWCHNGIRADRIDDELARLMKNSGCTSIALGIESGTKEVFDSIDKGESIDDILKGIQIIKNAGINVVGYFIIGLPADNLKNFIKTIKLQRALNLDHYTYGILIPYPKTQVWDIIHEKGRMLMDVTRTQHFSNDIVPISFSLPSFPPEDITRAYYLTKYFELFSHINNRKKHITICIELNGDDSIHLFGLLVSLPCNQDITVKCFNIKPEFTDEQQSFLRKYCKAKIQFPPGALKESKRFGDVCVISKSLSHRREFIWEKFFIFDSSDPLNMLKPRLKIVEFSLTMLIKIKNKLKKIVKNIQTLLIKIKNKFKLPIKLPIKSKIKSKIKKFFSRIQFPSLNKQNIINKIKSLNYKIGIKITNHSFKKLKKKLIPKL